MIPGKFQLRQRALSQNITYRDRLSRALAEQSARRRVLMEHASEAMLIVDAADGRLLEVNASAAQLYGAKPEELVRKTLWQLLETRAITALTEENALRDALRATLAGQAPTCECRQLDVTGRAFDAHLRLVRLSQDDPTLVLIYVSASAPSAGRQPGLKVRDALTGLVKRALFMDELTCAIERARRCGGSATVLLIKIDRFKYVNAALGDSYGNRVLQQVAGVLDGCMRAGDTIARLAGPQFGIFIEDINRRDDAVCLAEKIRSAVGARLVVEGHNLFLTASIGIASFPRDAHAAEGLLTAADRALTQAKELGGNRYQFFSTGLVQRADAFFKLRSALHEAIERGEFVLHYQPKIALASGRIIGVEALIRWQDPARGLVLPDEFIHAAEASGLIVPIGAWVLDAACRQLHAWSEQRVNHNQPLLRMAVNLSARQLSQPDLDLVLEALLQRYVIEPGMLELEITESMVLDDPDQIVQTLNRIRELGVRIALDDLGTGYSSLNHLKRLPIDVVKIDRSFVTDIARNKCDRTIVGAIVQMAHALGMEVVAEGVDAREQYRELRQCGCDAAQGFLISCPVPAHKLDAMGRIGI